MKPKIEVQIPKRSARGQMVDGWVTTLPFGTIRPCFDGGLLQLIVSPEYDDLHWRKATGLDRISIMVTTTESRDWLITWDRCYWRPFAIFGLRSLSANCPSLATSSSQSSVSGSSYAASLRSRLDSWMLDWDGGKRWSQHSAPTFPFQKCPPRPWELHQLSSILHSPPYSPDQQQPQD